MLQRDPERRPTARQLLRHPWLCGDDDAKLPASPRLQDRSASASGLPSCTALDAVSCGTCETGLGDPRHSRDSALGMARCISNDALSALPAARPQGASQQPEQQQRQRQERGFPTGMVPDNVAPGSGLQALGVQGQCGLLHALSEPSTSLLHPERLASATATAAPLRLGLHAAAATKTLRVPELPAAQSSAFEMALCWED